MKKIVLFLLPVLFFSLSGCESLSKMTGTTKSTVTITAVSLVDFPDRGPLGFPWDNFLLDKNPDIYFTIGKEGFKRRVFENVIGKPVTWSLQKPFTSNNLSQTIEFFFYDEDKGLNISKDDFMGSVQFIPSSYPSYPSKVTVANSGMTVELFLTWK